MIKGNIALNVALTATIIVHINTTTIIDRWSFRVEIAVQPWELGLRITRTKDKSFERGLKHADGHVAVKVHLNAR